MKRILIVTLCLLGVASAVGWYWQNPKPTGNAVARVWFANADTVYALDSCGAVLRSTDGGDSWTTARPSMGQDPVGPDLQFPAGGRVGYAIAGTASQRLLKTTDAGGSWTACRDLKLWLRTVEFPRGPDTGYVAGKFAASPSYTVVFRTTDGGATWDSFANPNQVDVNDISFPTSLVGYAAGTDYNATFGTYLKTTDAGVNWQFDTTALPPITSVCFPADPQTGYVCARSLYKTTDGGANWARMGVDSTLTCHDVWFPHGPDTGYVLASDSLLFRTTDAGAHWTGLPLGHGFRAFHFPKGNARVGCAGGTAGLIQTSPDCGNTWQARAPHRLGDASLMLMDVEFPADPVTGYACGTGSLSVPPALWKTTNGGSDWFSAFDVDSMHAFKALKFPVSPETGFVVGHERRGTASFATAWRTRNGGATWDTVLVDTAAADEFVDVEFPNGPDTGYALEHRNVAYWKTVDGGESWVRHATGISLYPMVTAFPSTSVGYIGCMYGWVLKTTNGGDTWNIVQTGGSGHVDVTALAFPTGPDTGFYSEGLRLCRTTDAGATWQIVGYWGDAYVRPISFPRNQTEVGCAGLNDGSFAWTYDHGENWIRTRSACSRMLWAVCFLDDTTQGWAVGNNGMILGTTPGLGGIEENPTPPASSPRPVATIVRGVLLLPPSSLRLHLSSLLDISGRKVLELHSGANDVSRLAPGVYFVRAASRELSAVSCRKVVLTR